MSFQNITGQKKASDHLEILLENNRIPTGFIFCGIEGIGKKLTALEFARILNCRNEKQKPCHECVSCKSVDKNIHPDITVADFAFQAELLELPVSKQQHIRIETIRELITKAQQKPALGKWKVFIIDKAETMLRAAGNALLKLLEEPPPQTLWILISCKKYAMLSTILSRCQIIDFAPLATSEVEKILIQKGLTSGKSKVLAKFCGGSVEKAMEIKEVLEIFSKLDTADINFPFEVSELLGRELVLARRRCRIVVELLIINCFEKWKKASGHKPELRQFMEKLHKFEKYLSKNVSPHRIAQVSLMEAEKFSINPFSDRVNFV